MGTPAGKYQWTPEMHEISGFGGNYEQACREMVVAGLTWLDEHPTADPKYAGQPGVKRDNADAIALSDAILAPVPDCSGAMHGAVTNVCLYVHKNGWAKYVEAMSKPRADA